MIRRILDLMTGLAALAATVALLAGIPYLLITQVGWPLPTVLPDLDHIRQFLNVGVSDATIIKVLAVIVWIAWAQIAAALIAESIARMSRRASHALRVLPGLQPLAARLIATVALITTSLSSPRVVVAEPLDRVIATAEVELPDRSDEPVEPHALHDASATATPTVTVAIGERASWWRLAETHLGDGLRWREIRDLNVGRNVAAGVVIGADTDRLEPGWRLVVPTQGATPSGEADEPAALGEWHVQPGDHFWKIASHTLQQAWGRAPTDAEIVPYWQQLIDANRDRLLPPQDPNLIFPEQQFVITAVPDDPTMRPAGEDTPAQDIEGTERDPDAAVLDSTVDGEDTVVPDADMGAPSGNHTDGWREAIEGAGRPTPQATKPGGWQSALEGAPSEQPTPPPSEELRAIDEVDEPRTALGLPTGLRPSVAASSLLAAGILATGRGGRRRRTHQQRPYGRRLPTPHPGGAVEIAKLAAAEPQEPLLQRLNALLCSIPLGVDPILVTITDGGEVTLLFDDTEPVPDPPPPWELADDGSAGPVGWTAQIGERGEGRSFGLPLLVTLGRTGDILVLANVAAMPSLDVHGPAREVSNRLRAMAMEVSASLINVPVEIVVAGDDRLASFEWVRPADDFDADIADSLKQAAEGIILEDRTYRLLVCHLGTSAPDVPQEVRGTVGVLAGAEAGPSGGWSLQIDDRTTGRLLLPDGALVDLDLPDVDAVVLDDELDQLADISPVVHPAGTASTPDPSTNGRAPCVQASQVDPAFCEVRVLGPVEVIRDGTPVEGLTRRPLEVLAYLATHRKGTRTSRIDMAICPGHDQAGSNQRVGSALTRIRRLLGDGPDGHPLVPARSGDEPIELSDHLGCDLDRVATHLAQADHTDGQARLDHLIAALALVRGEPFHDLTAEWTLDITTPAIIRLQDAAVEAARTLRHQDRLDEAETAVNRGLRLLDGNDDLYIELAHIAHAAGHPERIRLIRQRYEQALDPERDVVPSTDSRVVTCFDELLQRPRTEP